MVTSDEQSLVERASEYDALSRKGPLVSVKWYHDAHQGALFWLTCSLGRLNTCLLGLSMLTRRVISGNVCCRMAHLAFSPVARTRKLSSHVIGEGPLVELSVVSCQAA